MPFLEKPEGNAARVLTSMAYVYTSVVSKEHIVNLVVHHIRKDLMVNLRLIEGIRTHDARCQAGPDFIDMNEALIAVHQRHI